jgi:hypothetical protein
MADWTYAPQYDAGGEQEPPPTLQTKLSDKKVISRVKAAPADESWSEEFWLHGTEYDAAKAFYEARGVATPFTKLSYDLAGTPTTERSVRFDGPFSWRRSGPDLFIVTLRFVRNY